MGRKPKKRRSTEDVATDVSPRPLQWAGVRPDRTIAVAVCGLLLLAVWLVFGQTLRFGFVDYDDPRYVYENPHVTQGLTAESVHWAFTGSHGANWHPLTSLSHLLDWQLYGPQAGGHHATNVLLHAAAAIMLFLVLRRMTGSLWPAAFVAAAFAVHPLRAESVAWVSERKDVLSGLWFMLTLAAYLGYVRHPFSVARYAAVLLAFALGLMSKPMLVTLPFVLLLLDYWPLGRMGAHPSGSDLTLARSASEGHVELAGRSLACASGWCNPASRGFMLLVAEKIPLFLLAAASCVATALAQKQAEAVIALDLMPLEVRVSNALVACVAYMGQFFCPVGLAVYYPHLGPNLPLWQPIAAFVLLTGISVAALVGRRRFPALLVGWFWYLGMLVPVIGLVQVGTQSRADRYTYLPQIGLCIAVTWGASRLAASWPRRRWMCGILSALALATLAGLAWRQTSFWQSGEGLWLHALQCTSRNARAHNNLGNILFARGEIDRAMSHYREALDINPDYAEAHSDLGFALLKQGQADRAMEQFQMALQRSPDMIEAHVGLGRSLANRGQFDPAIGHFQKALEQSPDLVQAHVGLGDIFAGRGQLDRAADQYRKALNAKPDLANTRYNLGVVLNREGNTAEAVGQWRAALRLRPGNIDTLDQLAWALATTRDASIRNGAEAVALARQAVQLSDGRDADLLATLAAAYAEAGRFPEAVGTVDRAISLATAQGHAADADHFRAQRKLYRAGTPYRDVPSPPHK